MKIHRHNVESLGQQLNAGLELPVGPLPNYQTIVPGLLPTTRYVGALDGSDQQLFAYRANPEHGVGIWAVLFCEIDLQQAGQEIYRDGPSSAGAWSEDELLMYHLTLSLPSREVTHQWQNDLYAIRQVLANLRTGKPPLFTTGVASIAVRGEASRERGTGEWIALRTAVIHHLPPNSLVLRDGRLNCQMEMPAYWIDGLGRQAGRNQVRIVSIVKSGSLYQEVYPIVQRIAQQTNRPFWFRAPNDLIEKAYANDTYERRKTLMIGGRDNDDLAGIGALWTVFCPDPSNFATFVIVEFNVYDLSHYRQAARDPRTLRAWHAALEGSDRQNAPVEVMNLSIDDRDDAELVEPTLQEILWLCEQEIGRFGYPNLLGVAHHDVVLTKRKVDNLRRRYREILARADNVIDNLVSQEFIETPHKLHNIQ